MRKRHRRRYPVPVDEAIKLYDQLGTWEKVRRALPRPDGSLFHPEWTLAGGALARHRPRWLPLAKLKLLPVAAGRSTQRRPTMTLRTTDIYSHAELMALPEHQRNVLAAFIDGQSYQEIAASLHLAIGTVRSRLNRARGKIAALRASQATPSSELHEVA